MILQHVLANAGSGGTNLDPIYGKVMFWILATLAVCGAGATVLVRQAVHAALGLGLVMLSLAVMYAMEGAPFLAFVQVIVYTGAVLMLFLFVVMLIGVSSAESLKETLSGQRVWTVIFAVGFACLLIVGIGHAAIGTAAPTTSAMNTDNLVELAKLIFTTYVYPFEITSALLITAALGAMVLAHRERTEPKLRQRDIARRKIESGNVAPEPPPGVYALHNAVDMPALLPDGTTTDRSVSPAIIQRDIDLGRDSQAKIDESRAIEVRIEEERQLEAGAAGKGEPQ